MLLTKFKYNVLCPNIKYVDMTENIKKIEAKQESKLEQGVVFFFVWMGIAAITFGFFALIDFLPEKPSTDVTNEYQVEEVEAQSDSDVETVDSFVSNSAFPEVIIFDTLDRVVPILNPQTGTVAELDTALLSGVVRHPDSADFRKTGTIFLLGHSSYLPTVHNKNFQAFNGIQKLESGDRIRLRSEDTEYVYSVDRVYEAKASEASVPIQYDEAKLTLATCNSFGSKDDRYIVEANLVSKTAL